MRGDGISIFERGFSTILPRFTEEWQIYLDDLTIKTENGLQMRFDNISGQVSHDDHLPVRFGNR